MPGRESQLPAGHEKGKGGGMRKEAASRGRRTLGDVPTSGKVRIAGMDAVDSEKIRLIAMGFRKGVEIEMKNNSGKGPVVVALGNSRLALGRSLARKIWVA
jgi:Fe2+ transport system protein FeoA